MGVYIGMICLFTFVVLIRIVVDEFDCHFNHKQGILPKWFVASEEETPNYIISYSPQLPISSDIK